MVDRNVRVLIGTRKGGYIAETDTKRRKWKVRGPFQSGRDVYHIAPDPRRPGDVYAAVNSGFWGPMLFRSRDWGHRWKEIPPPQMPVSGRRPPPTPGADTPIRPVVNLWHLEPGAANEPRSLYLGIDPASLWRSDDSGASWGPVPGINAHPTQPEWTPGFGGLCLHTILIDPDHPRRMYVGISAAGTFRSDDGGDHWNPVNQGVVVSFRPVKRPPFGQCVHKVAFDSGDPSILYRQDHDGIYVSHDRMDRWVRIGRPLPDDFGFVVATAPTRPGEAFFVPLDKSSRITKEGHFQIYRWTDRSRRWQPLVKPGAFPGEFGTHREGLATDALDPAGIYLGTTTGQLFWSSDNGKKWDLLPYHFPGIHSVTVASPGSAR